MRILFSEPSSLSKSNEVKLMSKIDLTEISEDMSEAAQSTKKLYKKASRRSPSMKKEITVKTQYFSRKCDRHPCAESLFRFDIDCNIMKLVIYVFVFMIVCSFFCMMFKRNKCNKCDK